MTVPTFLSSHHLSSNTVNHHVTLLARPVQYRKGPIRHQLTGQVNGGSPPTALSPKRDPSPGKTAPTRFACQSPRPRNRRSLFFLLRPPEGLPIGEIQTCHCRPERHCLPVSFSLLDLVGLIFSSRFRN